MHALRADLLDGRLPPGTHLSEEQLAVQFGVGRYTIRAALRSLVTAGLVVHERHRGAFVPALTVDRIDELFAYRSVIELGSLRIALQRASNLSRVEDAVRELERLDGVAPWHDVTAAHNAVHRAIVAAADNPRLLSAYDACEDELQFMLAFLRPGFPDHTLARRHRALMADLQRGPDAAATALADDLEFGRSGLARSLEAEPADPDRQSIELPQQGRTA